jgi:hypothetical protein
MSEPEHDERSQQNSNETPQTPLEDMTPSDVSSPDEESSAEHLSQSRDDTPVFMGLRAAIRNSKANDTPDVEAAPADITSAQEVDAEVTPAHPSEAEVKRLRSYFEESLTFDEVPDDEEAEALPAVSERPRDDAYDTPVIMEAVSIPEEQEAETAAPEIPPEQLTAPYQDFEELTLAEALGRLRHTPLTTLRALVAVTRTPEIAPHTQAALRPVYAHAGAAREMGVVLPGLRRPHVTARASAGVPDVPQIEDSSRSRSATRQLVLRVIAFLLAWWGSVTMLTAANRTEAGGLAQGMPFLLIGLAVWLAAEFAGDRSAAAAEPTTDPSPMQIRIVSLLPRLALLIGACALGAVSAAFNNNNRFTFPGVVAWAGSVALAVAAVWPPGWSPRRIVDGLGRIRLRVNWVFIALAAILLLGSYFRLKDLNLVPREMTSDHVEMLNDAHRLLQGTTEVFFASNGGREAMQFYALALFSQLPGLRLDFLTLKLLGALESIITIPVMYWMAKTVIGERERRLGTLVGLLTAAFVATSYWHVTLSRMGERIVLMPLATALLIIFLTRALRYNRRMDFILAGLALGVGLYTYQAFRMAIVVVAIAGLMALIYYWRRQQVRRLLLNFAACGIVTFLIFLPLFAFSLENPEHFWLRTSGRLFGDALTQTTDENGSIVYRDPTIQEQLAAFQQNLPVLVSNMRNALLMYNWRGDVAWIQSFPNAPALDPITSGLFVVGAAAWIGRMFRRRDLFTWLFPVMFLLMLLPSALAIGMPIENPSATRISGTLPLTFMLVALPLAEMARAAWRLIGGTAGMIVPGLAAIGLVVGSYVANQDTYFVDYNRMYIDSSYPYSAGAVYLQSFGEAVSYSNAFIINRPGWWDYRAVGIDAGEIDYPNGVPSLAELPLYLENARARTGRFAFSVDDDILFFYAGDDMATHVWLQAKFPNGVWQLVQPYQPEDTFYTFRVPALGEEGYQRFIADAADDDLSQSSG